MKTRSASCIFIALFLTIQVQPAIGGGGHGLGEVYQQQIIVFKDIPDDTPQSTTNLSPINFGYYLPDELIQRAWTAYAAQDWNAVIAYADKCIELEYPRADRQQKVLGQGNNFPEGDPDTLVTWNSLNGVGTAYYLKGEVYRCQKMWPETKKMYFNVMYQYPHSQAWNEEQKRFVHLADLASKRVEEEMSGYLKVYAK